MTVKPSNSLPVNLRAEILFTGEVGIQISDLGVMLEPAASAPGDEFLSIEAVHLSGTLLEYQVIHRDEIRGGKAQLGKKQVDAVESKGKFAPKLVQIGLAQAWTVTNDETAFMLMDIFNLVQAMFTIRPARIAILSKNVPAAITPPPIRV